MRLSFSLLGGLLFIMATATWAKVSPPLLEVATTVDFGPDIGQNWGTLFEVYDDTGRVIAGAGFPGIYNTCVRLDRFNLQFYVRPESDIAPRKELLPRPSPIVHQSLQDLDGELYAWTYYKDLTVRRWDDKAQRWQDTDLLDRTRAGFGDGFMRVAGKLLVYQHSQAFYDGQLILPAPAEGHYFSLYYAAGHLCFFHTKSGPEGFTRLCAVPWRPGMAQADLRRLKAITMRKVGESPFVWGQLKGKVLTVSNWGTIAVFDGQQWRVLRWPVENKSYQIYTAVNYEDNLLLGQYPSGCLFRFDGETVTELTDFPPVMPGVATYAREAQSTMLYRGDLYVGVWPWAELWRYDRNAQSWTLTGRMFTVPPLTDKFGHPYEEEILAYNKAHGTNLVYNLWGQRICGLAPWRDSLMIATSAKGPMERDRQLPFLTDEVYEQYGRIWRYTLPGHLSAPIQYKPAPTRLTCRLERQRLVILQDGKICGEAPIEPSLVATLKPPARIIWGRGLYGPISCQLTGCSVSPKLSP